MATPHSPTLGGGRYVLDSRLGEGGQAAVFRARDLKLGVTRALKILLPRFATRAKIRARFAGEARAMAQLEHPNIVRVYDVETEGALPYLVMELVPSGSLADWLETYGAFPTRQAVKIAIQICAGAECAHAANIVHRDIKPQNVLVDTSGTCKLTDFGIARFEDSHQTRMGAVLGTEGYMAPEQGTDASTADVRSDVYGIGITLFVLATGTDPVEWLSRRGADRLHPALREILEQATAPDPGSRFPTAEALAAALRGVLERLPPDERPLPLGEALPVRAVDTEDVPESYVDVTAAFDAPPESIAASPAPALFSPLGPPPPARTDPPVATLPPPPELEDYRMSPPPPPPPPPPRPPDPIAPSASAPAPDPLATALASLEPASSEPLSEESSERGLAEQVLRAVFHPLQLIPLGIGLLLLAIAYGAWENVSARQALEDMQKSRDHLYGELASQRAVIGAISDFGGDRTSLEEIYAEWYTARGEPERSSAAVRFVESLASEADRVAKPGSVSWEELNAQVRRLRSARDDYSRDREAAESTHDSKWVFRTLLSEGSALGRSDASLR